MNSDHEVIVVGGGAAGIAAARRLSDAGVDALIVEARARLGGRAWTVAAPAFGPLDLGCGWLHSADRNPWCEIAKLQGKTIDKTPPPWMRPSMPIGFPPAEQVEFRAALNAFHERLDQAARSGSDGPASRELEPGGRWNGPIEAVGTYISGVETDRMSIHDFARYDDSGVNWRVAEGYGATIEEHARGLPVVLDCPVRLIDHSGKRLRLETAKGVLKADAAIITVPSALIADEEIRFSPALPEKTGAAAGLPLGLADKLFLSLEGAEEFDKDSRLFGQTDRVATGAYHFRPFGRPMIEGYFGGKLAAELEEAGEDGFFDFAVSELTNLFGGKFRNRIAKVDATAWRRDPFARGSYSYATPGHADDRAKLAEAVDDRLFFAGEACSPDNFSTAHGAYLTGVAAADDAMTARKKRGAFG